MLITVTYKGFTTLITFIGFLVCMISYVSEKSLLQCIGFATLITNIEFLSSMTSFIYLKVSGTFKGFVTLMVFIPFLSSLSTIHLLNTVTWKGFINLIIFIVFSFQMTSLVDFKRGIRCKGFIIWITFKEILFIIGCFVCLKIPSMTSRNLTMFFNIMVFPFIA